MSSRWAAALLLFAIHASSSFAAEPVLVLKTQASQSLAPVLAPVAGIRAFRDWKQDKIQASQSRIQSLRAQLESLKLMKLQPKSYPNIETSIQYYEKQVAQEQWNLELAEDLSVTDYVALYLSGQSSKTRFQEAAAQLSPADVAELLQAYTQNLGEPAADTRVAPLAESKAPMKAGSALNSMSLGGSGGQ